MRKIVCSAVFVTAFFVACVDRETVDRNPDDGVYNGGRPNGSPNYDSVRANGPAPETGNNILNEAKNGIDTDIHPENNNPLKNDSSKSTQK